MPRLSAFVGVFLALAMAFPAMAELRVAESTQYYPVNGRNGIDLGRAMLRGGAQRINLRHAIAATTTRFDFTDPKIDVKNGRCIVKAVTVKLYITYQLPQWQARGGASPAVRRAWDAFYKELVVHEKTHGRIARDFAKIVKRELKKLSGTVAYRCRDFGRLSEGRFAALAADLKGRQAAFDRRENLPSSRISRLQTALLKAK